ncbi:MAG: phage baseplate assembly protein V, partial [Caldilineaceae bacterium]
SWDVKAKQAIVGTAVTPAAVRSIGDDKFAASTKLSTVFAGESQFVDLSLTTASAVSEAAQAYVNETAEAALEVEADCMGAPTIVAGKKFTLANVGARFAGTYLITTARHIFADAGYQTLITASGWNAHTFSELVAADQGRRRVDGVMVALVTDNNETADSGKFGSVKVKYPYYSNSDASWWARYTSPMAGAARGLEVYPEVDDEVLVAFEDGDPNRPFVIGSLWNGKDALPLAADQAVQNGKVEKRIFKTRVGHFIEFNDKADEEQITIQDKAGNKMIFFAKGGNEKITIEAVKDMDIKVDNGLLKITAKNYDLATTEKIIQKSTQTSLYEATQDLTVKSAANIKGTATQDIDFAATANFKAAGTAGVTINTNANMKLSATANVEIAATAQFKASGTAMAEVSGGAMLKLGGALINIG